MFVSGILALWPAADPRGEKTRKMLEARSDERGGPWVTTARPSSCDLARKVVGATGTTLHSLVRAPWNGLQASPLGCRARCQTTAATRIAWEDSRSTGQGSKHGNGHVL